MKNFVLLLGHVGNDPDVKHFDDNQVANFNLATKKRGYTAKNGTEVPEKTTWHRIVVWGGLARVVEGHVKKGQMLQLTGEISNREYVTKEGEKRYITEILCNDLEFVGGKPQYQNANSHEDQPQGYGSEATNDLPF